VGSDTVAPPWLAVVAALGSVLASAERAVTLLLLGAVPLAGLAAYLVTGRVVRSAVLRVWAAVTYALLPPVLAAVATGRLGTAVLAVLLPVAGLAVARSIGLGGADRRAGSNRAMWAAVLLLAVMAAFVPLTLAATAVLGVAAVGWVRGANLLRVGVLVVAPVVLLLPWLPALVAEPALLLRESGLPGPGLAEPDLGAVHPLLLHPGGPGLPPLLVTVGLVLAALAALLRPDRRRVVLTGWLLALVGLAGAVLLSRATVSAPTLPARVPAWPGPATLLAGAGLLLAAVVGASGAAARVAASSFGWRQPAAGLVAVLAAVGPLVVAGWWLATGADGPVHRRDPGLLPAFVVAESTQPARPRTLVLRARPDGTVGYALVRSEGPRLGDAELSPPGDGGTGLSDVVADLASGRGGDAAARLVPYAVRFVLAAQPVPRSLSRAVDAVPGVVRVSGQAGGVLWEVEYPTGRLRLLPGDAPVSDPAGSPPSARVLPTGQVSAEAAVPAGRRQRLLVLADPVHQGWHARLSDSRPADSRLARATYDGWAQAFRVPPDGGRLELWHDAGPRPMLLWLQLVAVLAVLVLALPAIRTRDETEWEHR
jgi:hypothetical protein